MPVRRCRRDLTLERFGGFGFRVWVFSGLGFRVLYFGDFGCRGWTSEFRTWDFGGLGFRSLRL